MSLDISKRKQSTNAVKWINALLSGNYKQGKHKLGDEQMGFCCWGLGCHIVKMNYEPNSGWDNSFAEYVGFSESDGILGDNLYFYKLNSLPAINDDTKAGFKRIGKMLIDTADKNFAPHVARAIKKYYGKE